MDIELNCNLFFSFSTLLNLSDIVSALFWIYVYIPLANLLELKSILI